jgi:hypothetical protein
LAVAAWSASRSAFSRTESVALLDRQLKGGGLVMALAEADEPAWHDRLPKTPELWKRKLPKVRPARFFRLTGWPMAFVLGALLIPTRNPHPASGFSPAVGQQATTQLDTMLGLLEASHVLAPEEAAEMKAVIKQLAKESEQAPLTSEKWETVDALRKTLGDKLLQDEAHLADASRKLAKLMETTGGDLGKLLPESEADLGKVADILKTLSDRGALPELPESLGPGLEQLLKQGTMKLAEDPNLREQVFSQVQKLLQNRALDLQDVRSKFDGAFARLPALGKGDAEETGGSAETPESPDGSGTLSEKIKWGEKTDEHRAKFKQVVLPPGFVDDPSNQAVGITPGRKVPRKVTPSKNVSPETPTDFEPATGGEVRSRELRPRHRDVVKKYFQNEQTDDGSNKSPPSRVGSEDQ